MKIIGIDPGILKTGWVMIESPGNIYHSCVMSKSYEMPDVKVAVLGHGLIKTSQDDFMEIRLSSIYEQLALLLRELKPDAVCVEITIVNINPKTSIKLAEARGAIMAACGGMRIPLIQIPPNVIKKTISGDGHCDKKKFTKNNF